MGSSKSPPPPPPTPPPVRVTGAERSAAEQRQLEMERKRYDFSKTIVAGSGASQLPTGLKSTLG